MQRLEYRKKVHGQKLSAELIAVFPALADVQGLVEWNDEEAWVNVPDDMDPKAVQAVVQAHDWKEPAKPKDRRQKAREALADLDDTKPGPALKKIKAALDELLADD
jgi:hypothetical protein